jgi:hypothetical protein
MKYIAIEKAYPWYRRLIPWQSVSQFISYLVVVIPMMVLGCLVLRKDGTVDYSRLVIPFVCSLPAVIMCLPVRITCELNRSDEYADLAKKICQIGYVKYRSVGEVDEFRYPWPRWMMWRESDARLLKTGHTATITGPSFSMRMLYKRLSDSSC